MAPDETPPVHPNADGAGPRRWQRLIESDDADPLEVLRTVGTYQRYLSAIEAEAVQTARRLGRSWDEIAGAFGVTRQSAWARFGSVARTRAISAGARLATAIQLRCSCGVGRVFSVTSRGGTPTLVDPIDGREFAPEAVAWTCASCGQEHMREVTLPTF